MKNSGLVKILSGNPFKKKLGNLIHSGMEITDGSTSSPIILGKSNPSAPDTMPL